MEAMVKKHLASVYGMDLNDVEELFVLGRQTIVNALGWLERAKVLADMNEMVEAAHMLKGALFNMGLSQLGEDAKLLEMAAKQGAGDEVEGRATQLSCALVPLVRG